MRNEMPLLLIACDKFKGSLSALEVAEAVSAGLSDRFRIAVCPIADGGEGFVEAMLAGKAGSRVSVEVLDALGRPCTADYGFADGDAFIEMSAASGIWRIAAVDLEPRRASTFGTGQLMRHAVEVSGARRIFIGIGGSATNDGGVGMAEALGIHFGVDGIDESERIPLPEIIVACDVENPLCGERGASAIFGPQKGASPEDVVFLDRKLRDLAEMSGALDLAETPGAGAAGGLGFGLMRFAGARLVSGFDMVAEALGLVGKIAEADLVITGEGSLDGQTLDGKGPAGVAALCRKSGVPVAAVAGRAEQGAADLFDAVLSLETFGLPKEESIARAAELLERITREEQGKLQELVLRKR